MNASATVLIFNLTIFCASVVRSAKILGVFVIPSISHQIVFQPIWRELSLRGHEVTVITPNPLRDPSLVNLTEIDVSSARDIFHWIARSYLEGEKTNLWFLSTVYYPGMSQIIQAELKHPSVEDLIGDKTKGFDVVLIEALHPLLYAFGGRFNCPMVGLISSHVGINVHFAMGNPSHPITAPEIQLKLTENLNIFQRIESVLFSLYWRIIYKFLALPWEDKVARKHFGNDLPYLGDLEKNVSVVLANAHPLIHGIRSNVPMVTELGKVQRLASNKTLSHDLQIFLDSATEGVVYFSLGSMMKPAMVLKDRLDFIKETFSEIPQKVLWKWDKDTLSGKPENVMISKWVPQEGVLKHPNVKLFITQGGPQSLEEALAARVPILSIPLQYDQFVIAKRAAIFGIGRMLDIEHLNKEIFKEAIIDLVNNPRYKKKVEEFAALIEEQPINGLDNAVWWIEYVIRHKGARIMQSPENDVPTYQYYLLDVFAVVILGNLVLFYIMYKAVLAAVTWVRD